MKGKSTTSTTDVSRRALTLPYLTDVLVAQGMIDRETQRLLITHEQAERRAFDRARATGEPKSPAASDLNAAELLVFMAERLGLGLRGFSEERIVRAVASHLGHRFEKIDTLDLDLDFVASILSHPFARKHLMIPLRVRHGELEVAVADPFDLEGLDSIRRTSGYKVRTVLVTRTDLLRVVREFFGFRRSVVKAAREMAPSLDLGNLEQFVRMKRSSTSCCTPTICAPRTSTSSRNASGRWCGCASTACCTRCRRSRSWCMPRWSRASR
jgi:general secretion pathway protein E